MQNLELGKGSRTVSLIRVLRALNRLDALEVRLHGRTVGAVVPATGGTQFQFDPAWLRLGIDLAPFLTPISAGARIYEFRGLRPETFHFLPPMLADSLPDRFGNRIIDAWMARQGITTSETARSTGSPLEPACT